MIIMDRYVLICVAYFSLVKKGCCEVGNYFRLEISFKILKMTA